MSLAYLSDRTDPRVIAALAIGCTICKAKPGAACRQPWKGGEPLNRVVHQCRAEHHMDRGSA